MNDAYLDFNEAKVRGLEPDTFYKFELAGLVINSDDSGDFSTGPWVEITARTVGPGLRLQPGTPYPDGSGFAAQVCRTLERLSMLSYHSFNRGYTVNRIINRIK